MKMIKVRIKWEMVRFPFAIERINIKLEGDGVVMEGLLATAGEDPEAE